MPSARLAGIGAGLVIATLSASAGAVMDGTVDSANNFPQVVHVFADVGDGTSGNHCSGIVISPHWVMTAAHCFLGYAGGVDVWVPGPVAVVDVPIHATGVGVDNDVGVWFGQSPLPMASGPSEIKHAFPTDGAVLTLLDGPLDPFDEADIARDVAIFRVSPRIPRSLARPHHPAMTPDLCGWDERTLYMVGYGARTPPTCSDQAPGRTYGTDAWTKHAIGLDVAPLTSTNWVFPMTSLASATFCDHYDGALEGDSGGPLISLWSEGNMLCGLESGTDYSTFPLPAPTLYVWNTGASLDTPGVIAFLKGAQTPAGHRLFDPDTQTFDGECAAWWQICDADPTSQACIDGEKDSDGDGFIALCDACPNMVNAPGDPMDDADGDGVGDLCDVCPGHDDTIDTDGDGCPDLGCDPCVGDGALGADLGGIADTSCGDFDLDGICNGVDNCIDKANGNQQNTNALSETYYTPEKPWGDACEPVPQPRAYRGTPTTTVLMQVDKPFLVHTTSLVVTDVVEVSPQPSRQRPLPDLGASVLRVDVPGVPTHFRFCQPKPGLKCTEQANVSDGELHPEIASAADENPNMPYHRVTMAFGHGSPKTYDYDGLTTAHETWDYAADFAFWTATGIVTVPPPEPLAGPASGLGGTFWLLAGTPVGSSASSLHDVGTGWHGPQLANRYFPIDPEQVVSTFQSLPITPTFKPCFSGTGCQEVGLPWRWLVDPPWRPAALPGEAALLVASPGGQWGLLAPDGSTEVVTERLGPHLQASLADASLVWAHAVEPSPFTGAPDAPLALALTADGSAIAERVTRTPDGEGLAGELDRGVSAPPPPLHAPHACKGFQAVYARHLRSVYVIGDDDARTHARTGGLWRYALDSATWTHLPASITIGEPLAATVSFRDGGLYVLDEVTVHGEPTARLLRFDALRGGGVEIGRWPRQGAFDRLWLNLDHDGDLVLVASSRALGQSVAFLVGARAGEPSVTRLGLGELPLAWPLLIDQRGIVAYGRREGGSVAVARVPRQGLDATWASLGEVM